MRDNLRSAFESKVWGKGRNGIPRSGAGSTLRMTQPLRDALPRIFEQYQIKSFLDAPCGDWFWMQHVDLSGLTYIGGDISKEVVDANIAQFSKPGVTFQHLDITGDTLPSADLMLCRDCLMHLRNPLRWAFFENFAASDSRYLLTTAHHVLRNVRVPENGKFRHFNPMAAPFNLPQALELIPETSETLPDDVLQNRAAAGKQRSVGLWSKDQIIAALANREAKQAKGEAETADTEADDTSSDE